MQEVLSAAEVIAAAQCDKRAWLQRRERNEAPGSEAILSRAMVRQLRDVLPRLWPEARPIPKGDTAATAAAIAEDPTPVLLDASFLHEGVRAGASVLEYGRLIQLRAGTRVKERSLQDCALALWAAEGAGCDIATVEIAHPDSRFVYPGGGNYQGLLKRVDVTERVRALLPEVPGWVEAARAARQSANPPATLPGDQCRRPHRCPYIDVCLPSTEPYPIAELQPGRGLRARLAEANIEDLREVPAKWLTKPAQQRVHRAVVSGEPQIDPALIAFLQTLPYPRCFLDFEAVQFAVPVWEGTRPYQSLPFQFSLYIEPAPGARRVRDFLDLSGQAPMRPLVEALLDAADDAGPVFVYGAYERDALFALASMFPDLGEALRGLAGRVEDLLVHVKAGYYHRDMHGGASMKAVLPTLGTRLDYAALDEIREGAAAQVGYLEAIDPATPESRRVTLEKAMRAYCRLDTEALAEMVARLAALRA